MRDIVSRLQQGLHTARERGEELAQAARMRVEVFTLGREQEALYARLGRAYHDGASPEVLEGIQGELRRVSEEIAARERVLGEIAADPAEDGARPLPPATPVQDSTAAAAASPSERIPGAQSIGESPQGNPHGRADGSGSWPSPPDSRRGAPAEDGGSDAGTDPPSSSAAELWRKS